MSKKIFQIMICIFILSQIVVTGQTTTYANRGKNTTIRQLLDPNGNTLYVGGNGPGNFTRIYKAIDAASDGDKIFVFIGTYNECFTIDKSVILRGENKQTTYIVGDRHTTVRSVENNVTIHGFTICNTVDDYGVKEYGIHIMGDNTTVYDNIIADNCSGICLQFSSGNSIFDNTFYKNGLITYYSYENNIFDNTINGKELVYLEQASDELIDPDSGQVILVNCTNNVVKGLDLTNTSYGVQLRNTEDCQISDNTFSNGIGGISVINSHGNTISGNDVSNCEHQDGIRVELSSKNIIENNRLSNNALYGIRLQESCNNTASNNIITENYMGIGCWYRICRDNIITDNIISDNEECGVSLDASNNIVCNNVFSDNVYGGIQVNSYDHQILGNEFYNDGIYIPESSCLYRDNKIENNMVNGRPLVYLKDVSNKRINSAGQIILCKCNRITIENQLLNNTIIGMTLIQTKNCHISGNNLNSNRMFGLKMFNSNKNTITRNSISSNLYHGIYMEYSNRNIISKNHICNNKINGICLDDWIDWGWELPLTSDSNFFIENNIMDNKESDVYFLNSIFNRWRRNYWNDSSLVHTINGEVYIERGWHFGAPPAIEFDMRCYDWTPSRKPVVIENCELADVFTP
jgi:parallel beta-helix repeat protein